MRKKLITAALMGALAALALATVALAAPTNDNFPGSRIELTTLAPNGGVMGSASGNNTGATTQAGEPGLGALSPCGGAKGASVWYNLRSNVKGSVKIDSWRQGGGSADLVVAVYRQTGSGLAGLVFVGCEDVGDDLSFTAAGGTTYVIQVAGLGGDQGGFGLNVTQAKSGNSGGGCCSGW